MIVSSGYSETTNSTVEHYRNAFQDYMDTYILPMASSDTSNETVEDVETDFSKIEDNNDNEFEHDLFADNENLSEQDQYETVDEFFKVLFQNIVNHSPTIVSDKIYSDDCVLKGDIGTKPDNYKDWYKLTEYNLDNCLEISATELNHVKSKHSDFIKSLNEMDIREIIDDSEFSNDHTINSKYQGDGIVMVGGDQYSLLSFLSIKVLREFQTTLPVEVFIPKGESYDKEYCDELLPKYNAKCIYLSDIISQDTMDDFKFKGYQYKSLAIVASSFKNLLLLDADNFPITNLDRIFDSSIFKEKGLILWPDFWRRTTTPKYYDIAGIKVNNKNRVRNSLDDVSPIEMYNNIANDVENIPFHDYEGTLPDMSTESGQLMINKGKHLKTILLALYYNYNGPSWYYSIFSQRAAGEGDKETFIAAANCFNLPFYQVKTGPGVDGYFKPDSHDFRGVGILQHNFIDDSERYNKAVEDFEKDSTGPFSEDEANIYRFDNFYNHYFEGENTKEVDIMFIHANFPKFDPVSLYKSKDFIYNGDPIRAYNNLKRINNFDIELSVYSILNEFVCLDRLYFPYLRNALDNNEDEYSNMCKYIDDKLRLLKDTHNEATSSNK